GTGNPSILDQSMAYLGVLDAAQEAQSAHISLADAAVKRGRQPLNVARAAEWLKAGHAFSYLYERSHGEGDRRKAEDCVTRSLELRDTPQAWWVRAELARVRGRYGDALEHI